MNIQASMHEGVRTWMQRYMCEHMCGNDIDAETSAYMYDAHAYTYADECAAAYFHACSMHTHTHTYIHTYTHTHIQIQLCKYLHIRRAYRCGQKAPHIHTCRHLYMHICTYIDRPINIHPYIHICTRTADPIYRPEDVRDQAQTRPSA